MQTASHEIVMWHFSLLCFFVCIPVSTNAQTTGIESAAISFSFVKKGVSGTVSDFKSTTAIDWNDLENSIIEGQVAAETIKTGNFIRDFALRRSTYFDVDTYPLITFRSTKIQEKEDDIHVEGMLTLKGISKPLTISFTKDGDTLIGKATLYSSDFDIVIYKKGRDANKVVVTFTLQLE